MVAHRRAGKTVACVADLVLAALFCDKHDGRYAYIAPQFNQAKDVAWLYVKRLTVDIPGTTYNEAELRANLPNGAQVRLYGADNPDRLRGLYLDGVILDEYADMKPRVWGEIIRPLLADRRGWAAFIGTPKGKNEFWKVWSEAGEQWFRLRLLASESGLLNADELTDARRSMSEDQYEQEFECSFEAAITGAFYGRELSELEKAGRVREVRHDPKLPVFTAWDLGLTDDTAIWFFQVLAGEIRLIDFFADHGKPVAYYAGVVKERGYTYGRHWLPHDAVPATLAANGRSILEQLVGLGLRCGVVPKLDINDGIQATRLMLPRCYFDKDKCADGLEALKQYQREWDEDHKRFKDKPRHDWTSHAADAFRYLSLVWKAPAEEKKPEAMKLPQHYTMNDWIKAAEMKEPSRRTTR